METPRFQLAHGDAVAWLRSLPAGSVDLVVTDPPYESLEKHRAVGTTTRLKHSKASSNDWFSIFPNERFPELFAEVYRVLKKDRHFYLYCDPETMFVAKPLAEAAGFKFWKPIIWDKCLGPDTPVWTERGVLPIAEIVVGDRVALPNGGTTRVRATRRTRSPSVKLKMSDGSDVIASRDHRFQRADGSLAEAAHLKVGELLRTRAIDAAHGDAPKVWRIPTHSSMLARLMANEGVAAPSAKQSGKAVKRTMRYFVAESAREQMVRELAATIEMRAARAEVGAYEARATAGDAAFVAGGAASASVTSASAGAKRLPVHGTDSIRLSGPVPTSTGQRGVRATDSHTVRAVRVVGIEELGVEDLVDISIDHPDELFLLANGVVTHNCKIGMGYHYRARYECILFFEKGKRKLNDLGVADILEAPRISGGYPAEKPPSISETLITQSTEPGELVVDPFMGSGSVGFAAISRGRNFMGNDLCKEAVDITRSRLLETHAAEAKQPAAGSTAPQLGLML